MKVFRVLYYRDSETIKKPDSGETVTNIITTELRYAADEIEQVWNAIEWIRKDEELSLIAVHEEHPAIIIINTVKD